MTYREDRDKKLNWSIQRITEELPEFCHDFIAAKADSKELSTAEAYAIDLKVFFNFMLDRFNYSYFDISEITAANMKRVRFNDIEAFLRYLNEYTGPDGRTHRNGENGKARKLAAISSLYDYLVKAEVVETNPAAKVEPPKRHKKQIITLSQEQVEAMFDVILTDDAFEGKQLEIHQKEKKRDAAILMFLLGTGVRVSELVGLNLNDLDLDACTAQVIRKGGNEDTVHFSSEVREFLELYLGTNGTTSSESTESDSAVDYEELESAAEEYGTRATYKPSGNGTDALFVSRQHNRLSVRTVQYLIKMYANIAFGEDNHITPHKMRSTFGTYVYETTGDLLLTSKTLGHASTLMASTTYVRFPEDRKKEAVHNILKPNKNKEQKEGEE